MANQAITQAGTRLPEDDETHRAELLELERRFWQAMLEDDVEAALDLCDDPCIVAGPQGVLRLDKTTFSQMMRDSTYTLERFEIDREEVRMLGDDVGIVAYRVKETMTVDGQRIDLECADTSTWIRRDGRWVCTLHSEAIIGDPFGRDRSPPRA